MLQQVNLSSNGKLHNLPLTVFLELFKNKHWRELTIVYEESDDVFEEVLTSCLDDVIDFEKTGSSIKSSNELPSMDRLKLFLFQMVNCKNDKMKLIYNCKSDKKCGEFTVDFDLMSLKEQKLNKKLGEEWLDSDKTVLFEVPVKKDEDKIDKMITDHKILAYEAYRKIMDKIDEEDEEETTAVSKKIEKLKEKYYVTFEDGSVNSWQDINIDPFCSAMIMYSLFMKGKNFDSLKDYLDWVLNDADSNINKKIEDLMEKYKFGYDNSITLVCPECGKKHNTEISLSPKFFFQ